MLTTNKIYACYAVKFFHKKKQNNFSNRGVGAPGAPVLYPPLKGHSQSRGTDLVIYLTFVIRSYKVNTDMDNI